MSGRGRKPNEPVNVRVGDVIVQGKRCTKCSKAKPYARFDRLWRASDGRTHVCKLCKREQNAKRSRAKVQ